jgi:tetratricopeptide (TPR) repeat protein
LRDEIDSIALTGDPAADKKTGQYMMKLFREKLMALHAAVQTDPQNPELHYLLSRNYLVLFELLQQRSENQFVLAQIRSTIEQSGFESDEEISEWLNRAVGENLKYAIASGQHAERALQLNPLQANAYLQVAETGFLMGRKPGFEKECVAQARALWPYDGQVLYIAGRDAASEGDLEKMMELWKSAFHSKPIWQERIINYVVTQVEDPVPLMIAEFEPSIDGLERIVRIVETRGDDRDRTSAWSQFATQLMARAELPDNSDRVDDWLKAGTAYDKLGQPEKVTACLEKAITAEPSSFVVNFEFGVWLHRQREHRKALVYFERCQLTRPDYPKLTRLIAQAEEAAYGAVRQASGQESSPRTKPVNTGANRFTPNRETQPRQFETSDAGGIDNRVTPMLLPAPGNDSRPAVR